jgi:transcription initiation factor TFIIIB Brf1 subunit/transcription initiation factor TFIIB
MSEARRKWLLKAAGKEADPHMQIEFICQALATPKHVRRAIQNIYRMPEETQP